MPQRRATRADRRPLTQSPSLAAAPPERLTCEDLLKVNPRGRRRSAHFVSESSRGAFPRRGGSLPQARVECVVEPLAYEVDGKDREQDGHARNCAEPPGQAQDAAPRPHLETPAHHVGIREPEER